MNTNIQMWPQSSLSVRARAPTHARTHARRTNASKEFVHPFFPPFEFRSFFIERPLFSCCCKCKCKCKCGGGGGGGDDDDDDDDGSGSNDSRKCKLPTIHPSSLL